MDKISASELVAKVAETTGESKALVKKILAGAAIDISCYAKKGQAVAFPGLGKFYPATRSARNGRHPISGEEIVIPAKRALAFKPGTETKDLDK